LNPFSNIITEFDTLLSDFIEKSLNEDIGFGDVTTLSTIPEHQTGKAQLLVKDNGVIAGVVVAEKIFNYFDKNLFLKVLKNDGEKVVSGESAFFVEGKVASILITERLVLNLMQRLSGIATKTRVLSELIKPYGTKLLDTRKTTPNMRFLEKWAVRIGGGFNHRFGLYDMVLIKDNHVDASGGIANAVAKVKEYLKKNDLSLKIEVEVRNFTEIEEVLKTPGIDRVLIDNFTPSELIKAIKLIDKQIETEASGKINEDNIVEYAATGVDYISSGSLTHTIKPLDLSLKIMS